ncbi:dockerin type I domain-containing protein [Salinirubellus sp. GCM10025818]|uniref:dockerin type I domain-containing protein n=1 Tax=Salinirubellus TaxID=2162630 RepID=UPI0030D59524
MGDGDAASGLFHALGIVSTDARGVDEEAIDQHGARNADGRSDLGSQQQSGWNHFFSNGLDDLIPDTAANGGGYMMVYHDEERVKSVDPAGEERWKKSYETELGAVLPISETNGGGYLLVPGSELVRLGQDGSTQWRRSYESEDWERNIDSIIEAGSNGFLVGGNAYPDDLVGVTWVAKINGDGAITWELKEYLVDEPPTEGAAPWAYDVHRAEGGGYLIEVRGISDRSLVKLDESGAIEWNLGYQEINSRIYVTDEGSIIVVEGSSLMRVTGEGTIQWTKEVDFDNYHNQILEGENGFLVAGWRSYGEEYILEMIGGEGRQRWWRSYDQRYTIGHGKPDGYVLFGDDTVRKISAAGANEWERPLYTPTDIEHLSHLDGGGYLLGGGSGPSWVAMRENFAGGLAVLPDVDGDGNPSQDPDGDGRFEDVNGDGSTDVGDAQALYNNRNTMAIKINRELYDFNDDGAVNVGDAQALFAEVTEED